MNKIIIGCDPDSDKSGFSVYRNGKLTELSCMSLMNIIDFFRLNFFEYESIELHIENLNGNNSSAFNHRSRQPKAVQNKISESVGKCKQVQIEIERIAEYFDIKVVHHPVSSMWKKDKAQFEKVTGWAGRSNEDSRSACWMGYQGVMIPKK